MLACPSGTFAQGNEDPTHRLSIGISGNYHTANERVGLSGHIKWLFPTQQPTASRFLITGKASHTPPSNGGFFNAFDKGRYDNISAVHLMGGYRVNLFDKHRFAGALAPVGPHSAYLELNMGGSYIGYTRNFGFAINPVFGYAFNQRVELNVGYQGTFTKTGVANLNLLELGVAYCF